jgi:hypothetical protein
MLLPSSFRFDPERAFSRNGTGNTKSYVALPSGPQGCCSGALLAPGARSDLAYVSLWN